jgi:hypothetical protein
MKSLQITFNSMAVSMGVAMHNASTNQRNGQLIANASLTISCKLILSTANSK